MDSCRHAHIRLDFKTHFIIILCGWFYSRFGRRICINADRWQMRNLSRPQWAFGLREFVWAVCLYNIKTVSKCSLEIRFWRRKCLWDAAVRTAVYIWFNPRIHTSAAFARNAETAARPVSARTALWIARQCVHWRAIHCLPMQCLTELWNRNLTMRSRTDTFLPYSPRSVYRLLPIWFAHGKRAAQFRIVPIRPLCRKGSILWILWPFGAYVLVRLFQLGKDTALSNK